MNPSFFPRERTPVYVFTFFYIVAFSIGFFLGGNYEFVIYTIVMLAALGLAVYLLRRVRMPIGFLWALSFVGVLHMLGGGLHVNGARLYALKIVDLYSTQDSGFELFRYDQLVHFIGYGVVAVVIHHVVRRAAPASDPILRGLITICIVAGLGSLNELAEFTAVLSLPRTGVGDYFNTMLDLSFNTLGAVLGVSLYETYERLKRNS